MDVRALSTSRHTPAVDVAVVGGGVIGLSVAWRAAQRGLSVRVLERDAAGSGASHVAAGMLAPVSEAEFGPAGQRLLTLGLAAAARWPAFAAELEAAAGLTVGHATTGTLVVARDRDAAEALERRLTFLRSLDVRADRLRPSQARELEPALAPTVRLGMLAPEDHSVDPRQVTAALARAAEAAGAEVVAPAPVQRVLVQGEGDAAQVTGVALASGVTVAAGAVVVAAGAWSAEIEGLPAAARAPVRPVKGQILRLRDPAGPGLVARVLRYEGGYLVPRGDGGYVLGATMEERGFETAPTAGGVLQILREARELVPGVTELELEEVGVGLRPGSPDNVPIVGPAPVAGLYWAAGHHRNGVLLAPVTADIVADALTGADPSPLAHACAPERLLSDQGDRAPAGAAGVTR